MGIARRTKQPMVEVAVRGGRCSPARCVEHEGRESLFSGRFSFISAIRYRRFLRRWRVAVPWQEHRDNICDGRHVDCRGGAVGWMLGAVLGARRGYQGQGGSALPGALVATA